MSSFLKEKEVVGMSFDGEVRLAAFHDGMYAFVTSKEVLYSFDTISLQKIVFDPPDKSIKSSITSIALSPSHDLIALGFLDGSIQTYQLPNPKPYKVISKARKGGGIIGMQFINQSLLLFFDMGSNIVVYDTAMSVNLFKAFTKEKIIGTLASPGISLTTPPIYRNTSASTPKPSAKCTNLSFQNSFVLVTAGNTILGQYINDEFKVLSNFENGSAYVDFIVVNETTMLFALFSNTQLNIYSVKFGVAPEIIKTYQIEESCALLSFLNEKMIAIVTTDDKCIYLMIDDGSQTKFSIKSSGLSLHTGDCFSVFSEGKVFQNFLPTFQDNFDDYRNADNLEEARQLCLRAFEGESSVCIGLPTNPSQRFLVVQSQFMSFFEQSFREQVEKGQNLEQLIDKGIKISQDMKCNDWITTKLFQIFKDEGKESVYFKRILELDPKAEKFFYTTEFFTSLIAQKNNNDIFDFIKMLPEKVAPHALVLKYAIEKKNIEFALSVCMDRLKDIISAVNILFNEKMFSRVIEFLTKYIVEQEGETCNYPLQLISWVLSHSKEGTPFPRVSTLLKAQGKNLAYFDNMHQYILKHGKPITLDTFMNTLIMIVTSEKLGFKSKIFVLATNIFLENNVKIMGSTLKVLLTSSFSTEFADPDQREKVILCLMERGYLDKMMDTLMPICESFNFKTARGQIMLKGKKYEAAIKEMLEDPATDVYTFINNMLDKEPECKPTIKKALEDNATLLFIKDSKQFVDLVFKHFNDMILTITQLISDPKIVNAYLHQLLTDPRTNTIEIPAELSDQYIQFICNYYPNDVLDFLRSRKDAVLTDYQKACRENNILDALVYIDEETMNLNAMSNDIVDLISELGIKFADGLVSKSIAASKFDFIIEMLKAIVTKFPRDQLTEQMLLSSIKALAVPLFAIGNSTEGKDERAPIVRTAMHRIVNVSTGIIKFDKILKFLVDELAELKFIEAKETLTSVINDYTYDIDSDIALAQLFEEDEAHAYEDFIIANMKGFEYKSTTCCTCHKRLDDGGNQVRFFKCGHVFHDKEPCLTRDICPICFAEERLDEKNEAKNGNMGRLDSIIKRKLSRFEADIVRQPTANSMYFDDAEGEVVMDPPTATELPLE